MRCSLLCLLSCLLAVPLAGQADGGGDAKFRLALLGFAARAGIDVTGDDQLIFGTTLDLGDLYTDRLRMRASGEIGLGGGADTYVIGGEATYRLVADTMPVVPYVGGGAALYSREGCDAVADCPALWAQFVVGFEINLRAPLRWLLEYHAQDGFGRHRFLIGLTTKRER